MNRVFLVMVVSSLLVTFGFAQTPDAGSNTDPAKPAAAAAASSATVSTPAVDAAAPAATVSPSSQTVIPPAANATRRMRPSAHPRRLSATQAATATAPAATVSPSSEPVSTTAPAATTNTVTHRGGSLWLLVSFLVLVIVLGTLTPLLGRWRKRKMLERTGSPNLSFTNETSTSEVGAKEASSELDKPQPRKVA